MTDEGSTADGRRERRIRGRTPPTPPRRVGRHDETSLRGGALGVAAVIAATLAISTAGALISFIVSLLY